MSKNNIFGGDWIDMVFEGRNKKYGAYQLRSENPKTTMIALGIGVVLFAFAVSSPKIIGAIDFGKDKDKAETLDTKIEMVELPPPPVEEVVPPPPPPVVEEYQAPKSVVEEVKFKPLEVKKKEEIVEEPPKVEQFEKADPSSRNADADPNMGDIVIGKPPGDLDRGVEVDDNQVYTLAGLQVQPEFPGGMASFYNYVNKNFRIPDIDQNMQARIFVSFVVEKDGSMTDIKVTRDPGYGLGKEAERVLKSLKTKWNPGIQNGKPVRARYNLPIVINIRS
ncbi:energy transducer TonB [Flavobacterium rhizosphaerae]|uniref:Energy transducer TonB n=1 Tax=Flavobacterium rhizosphaerae TaxID=3163298 RepID=A0ABW8Z081_9FLAO